MSIVPGAVSIVHANGVRLWTAVSGEGPPLILCHGGPGAPDYLGSLARRLPARTHRFEQRGCGRSEDAEPNDVAALVRDIDALREHWGIETCVLAGHSWGAALALTFALEHPDRVERLLYLNGNGIDLGWQEEHAAATRRLLSADALRRYEGLRRAAREASTPAEADRARSASMALVIEAECRDPELIREILAHPFRPDVNRRLNDDWAERTRDPGLADRVGRCRVPALVLQGAADPRPRWPAKRLAALLPVARYVELEGAGHFPWVDRPDAFAREVVAFLG